MQKVSKQSLAMLALSILLAISIALTFTFAAVSKSATAKGTITFAGEYFVAWAGAEADTGAGNIKFTLTQDNFDLAQNGDGTVTATLKSANKGIPSDAIVTFSNTTGTETNYTITDNGETAIEVSYAEGATGTVAANGKKDVTLANIVSNIVIADVNANEFTIVFTATIGA